MWASEVCVISVACITAVALPVAKALWNAAGLEWPEATAEAEQSVPDAEPESQAVSDRLPIGDTKMETEQINQAVAEALAAAGSQPAGVFAHDNIAAALAGARGRCGAGDCVVVFGSFTTVEGALRAAGLV
jgi:hypothetical protein